jgi:hypothetical protein
MEEDVYINIKSVCRVPTEEGMRLIRTGNSVTRRDVELKEIEVDDRVINKGFVIKCKSQLFDVHLEQLVCGSYDFCDDYNLAPPIVNQYNMESFVFLNMEDAERVAKLYLETENYEIVELFPYGSEERERQMAVFALEYAAYLQAKYCQTP